MAALDMEARVRERVEHLPFAHRIAHKKRPVGAFLLFRRREGVDDLIAVAELHAGDYVLPVAGRYTRAP